MDLKVNHLFRHAIWKSKDYVIIIDLFSFYMFGFDFHP